MKNVKTEVNFYWEYFFKNKVHSEEVNRVKFLQTMPFFSKLSLRQVRIICNYLHYREYEEGEYLFEYAQAGAALFLIQSGEVSIEIPSAKGISHVATLEANSFLGEMALLSSAERTASARTTRRTKCLALYRNDLDKLGEDSPEVAVQIYKSLARVVGARLEATTIKITELKQEQTQQTRMGAA